MLDRCMINIHNQVYKHYSCIQDAVVFPVLGLFVISTDTYMMCLMSCLSWTSPRFHMHV